MAVVGPTAILLLASACAPPPTEPDPALLEAVDWYTGVAGTVDNARSRALLEEAVSRETPLAVMWQARVHSTGRMGYPRDVPADLGRALDWYRRAAAAGNAQAREALERLAGRDGASPRLRRGVS